MLRKIPADAVKKGMYVSGFGGSWFDHPFWRAKFVLASAQDVERVRNSSVTHVVIDDALGVGFEDADEDNPALLTGTYTAPGKPDRRKRKSNVYSARYHNSAEHRQALQLVNQSKEVMRGVFTDARLGCAIHAKSVNNVVENIIDAVAIETDVFLTVARLKTKDDYTYLHSVAVCALMVSVARYLELDEADIRDLGLAGLLHDVGKMSISDQILNKPDALTDEEFKDVRLHPEKGYQLLRESAGMPETALDVCRHHHEKINGRGYPFGLSKDEISFAARLGAVCDVYDALTSDRIYKKAWGPHKAIGKMCSWEGHFDPEILAAFMHALNIFPPGLLVRLSSDRLALVLGNTAHNADDETDPGNPDGAAPLATAFCCALTGDRLPPEVIRLGKRTDQGEETITSVQHPDAWGFADWDALCQELRGGLREGPRGELRGELGGS